MENAWRETLDGGDLLLIDGGMGTELQRRGVPMDKVAWSGAAVLTHPDIVRETHEDYIRAGAKVIITNTFGSTRQMLEPAGYGDQVESVHRGAVKLARHGLGNCCFIHQIPESHLTIGVFCREPAAIRSQIQKVDVVSTFLQNPRCCCGIASFQIPFLKS